LKRRVSRNDPPRATGRTLGGRSDEEFIPWDEISHELSASWRRYRPTCQEVRGYRATAVERTIVGAARMHAVPPPGGFEAWREGWRAEVRAGAVVLAALHVAVVALTLILPR